ncbi:MAG: hypothetical protein ACTHKG_21735 [Nocardioides sp.]
MGMTSLAARRAVRSAHVLVVEVPGHWATRVHVERAARERGWRRALSPADADVLVVCGEPDPDLAELVERIWEQLPGPRARAHVLDPDRADAALDRARDALLDLASLRKDARSRATEPDMDHGDMDHGDMDHGDMDHGDMDHGDMDMSPGGIPLAGGGKDRDGLEMDVLHLPLGPVLAYWPAGLVLRCTLQGDVIVSAQVERLDAGSAGQPVGENHQVVAAVRLDNAARLLALAGWQHAATRAERLRDALITDPHTPGLADDLEALRRRVARSRLLRWSLRRIRTVGDDEVADNRWPAWWAGDVHARLLAILDRAGRAVDGTSSATRGAADVDLSDALPRLVAGLDLATARLVVASLDLDPIGVAEVARG